jgi:hypothetical protein
METYLRDAGVKTSLFVAMTALGPGEYVGWGPSPVQKVKHKGVARAVYRILHRDPKGKERPLIEAKLRVRLRADFHLAELLSAIMEAPQ